MNNPQPREPRTASRRRWQALAVAAASTAGLVLTGTPADAAIVPAPVTGTLASANPSDLTPHAQNGEVRAFAQVGNLVYVGGTFTSIKAAGAASWTARSYLFAYDRTTGAISTAFTPTLDGAVNTMAVSPDGKLLVGGAFKTVNGVATRQIVALNPADGSTISSWAGRSDGGVVRTMVVRGTKLYVGGAFHYFNGTAHSLLARLDADTGAIDSSFQIDASVPRAGTEFVWTLDVAPNGSTLVAGGNFTQVNGQPRNQLVMVDVSGTPAVANWQTTRYVDPCYSWAFDSYVQSVDFADDSSYFVVGANGGRGSGGYCDAIARFDTSVRGTGVDGTWVDYTGTDTVTAVEATDNMIYAAGHFRWLNNANGNDSAGAGAIDRLGIGALDPSNGMPVNWNPRRAADTLPAGTTAWGSAVPVLWRGTDGIYFGQNSDAMGNEYHGRLGMFPLSGSRTVAASNAPQGGTGYLYLNTGVAGSLTKVPFDGTTLGTPTTVAEPNLTGVHAAFQYRDKLFWAGSTQMEFSQWTAGTAGAPWTVGFNSWFNPSALTGMFGLNGRMYYTKSGSNALYYRYIEADGYYVGCTEFTAPTANLAWGNVRGMTWSNGKIVYGSTDGSLRSVAFDPTAATAVDGSSATVLAPAATGLTWSNPTLFFANS